MHSAWFSRDSTGIVSFLRARRSGRTQKRFEKDNNSVDAFFQLVLGYIDWKIVSQSGQSACCTCWYAFFVSRSIYVGVRVEFFSVSMWHRQNLTHVQPQKTNTSREKPILMRTFPISRSNYCWRPCWIFLCIKMPLLWGAIFLRRIISKAHSLNLHIAGWTLLVS